MLKAGGRTLSANDYDIVMAARNWATPAANGIAVFDPAGKAKSALAGLKTIPVPSLANLAGTKALIIGDLDAALKTPNAAAVLKAFVEKGGRLLLLQPGQALCVFVPEFVKSYRATQGEIVSMVAPESPLFDGIEPLDLSWFETGTRTTPIACTGTWEVNRERHEVGTLAHQCDIHGAHVYGSEKLASFFKIAGAPIVELQMGKGAILAEEMALDAKDKDPIAGRLLANEIAWLTR